MQITIKISSFLFAWIAIIIFGTLALGSNPIYEKFLYLFVAVCCESWILFRLPGSKSLWIFPKNADNAKYREIRIMCAVFLWFVMLGLPRGFDLFSYYLFALCIERAILFCSLSKKQKELFLQKFFPPYKEYGAPFLFVLVVALSAILIVSFWIGEGIARWSIASPQN